MKLVFVHGRAQEGKDPHALRGRWVAALRQGITTAGLELAIPDDDIVFPFYGDALSDATSLDPESLSVVRYPSREHLDDGDARERDEHIHDELGCGVLVECFERVGMLDAMVGAHDDARNATRPITTTRDETAHGEASSGETSTDELSLAGRLSSTLTNEWVQRGLSLLDRYVPGASARSLEATAADVSQYLRDTDVQDHIEHGVARAFDHCAGEPTVVVGHSLGSIVAYRVLRNPEFERCNVKSFITLGSPLGLSVVRQALEPIGHPPDVDRWFNAYDERDVVALHPLDDTFFPVDPSIENHAGVVNDSDNHHKIEGYLSDPTVLGWIADGFLA